MTKKHSIEYKEEMCIRIEVGSEKQIEVCREVEFKVGTLRVHGSNPESEIGERYCMESCHRNKYRRNMRGCDRC